MRKPSCICVIVALFMVMGCATLQNLIGQPQLETYTFNFNGKDYSALLPRNVSLPPEKSIQDSECFPFKLVCVLHVEYTSGREPIPRYPVASFWLTAKFGVVGLVWHTINPDGTKNHKPFLYIKGLPVLVSVKAFNKFMNKELPLKVTKLLLLHG